MYGAQRCESVGASGGNTRDLSLIYRAGKPVSSSTRRSSYTYTATNRATPAYSCTRGHKSIAQQAHTASKPPRIGKPKPAQASTACRQTRRLAVRYSMSALKAAGPSLKASVASLYRSFLREAKRKDPSGARGTVDDIKRRFRTDATNVGRREFQRIEFMLREGHKKLKLIKMDGVTAVGTRWGAKR